MTQFAKLSDVKAGTVLVADAGFTCIGDQQRLVVKQDKGELYVDCADGHHHLDGQLDDGDELIGFTIA